VVAIGLLAKFAFYYYFRLFPIESQSVAQPGILFGRGSRWRHQNSIFSYLPQNHFNITAQFLAYYNRMWRQIFSSIRHWTVEIDIKHQKKILASPFLRGHGLFRLILAALLVQLTHITAHRLNQTCNGENLWLWYKKSTNYVH